MVSDTLALLICKLVNVFIKENLRGRRPADPKSCRTQREFLSIRPSVHPSVHPSPSDSEALGRDSESPGWDSEALGQEFESLG